MNYVSIGQVSQLLGISISTAYRWIKSGKLIEAFRTPGNHRRFDLSYIHSNFITSSNDK
jgi:excisionase family DNA binding protein